MQAFVGTRDGAVTAAALINLHERLFPAYCEELAGMADAAGLDYAQACPPPSLRQSPPPPGVEGGGVGRGEGGGGGGRPAAHTLSPPPSLSRRL